MKFMERCKCESLTPRQSALVLSLLCPTVVADMRDMRAAGIEVSSCELALTQAGHPTYREFHAALNMAKHLEPELFGC